MRAHSQRLVGALAVSLAVHGILLASVAPPPRTQPRYVVLEARLKMPEYPGISDFLTVPGWRGKVQPGPRGPLTPQSPTPPKKEALRALSDLTLPHDSTTSREFAPGFEAQRTLKSPLELPMAEPARYFKASELEKLAEPVWPIAFDRATFAAGAVGGRILRMRVFIDEGGQVDDVKFEDPVEAAALSEELRREFLGTRFFPALRQGRAVKSQKLIEIFAAAGD